MHIASIIERWPSGCRSEVPAEHIEDSVGRTAHDCVLYSTMQYSYCGIWHLNAIVEGAH